MNTIANQQLFYKIHVFCCTNVRPPDHERGSCGGRGSEALINYMKVRCKELGIKGLRVNKAGCLDRCELGPVMVIYPQGIWYHYENKKDIEQIIFDHIIQGKIVNRLVLM